MRSRRRKGRRNRDGLWICGIAVLAAGAVFTARTEILDLVTTEIAFVLDPKQEGGEKESDQDIAERVESTDGGKETLTDGGVDLAETDEAGADPDQKNTDAGTEASGSGNSDPEAIELPSSYDIREHRTVSVSDQGDLGTCWAFAALKAVETSMPESMAVPLSADHMSIHNSFGISQNSGGDYSMAMAYLLAWQGPVSEEDDPYGDSTSPDGLAPVCHAQEIRILPERNYDAVKRAVYLYGGVQTSLYLPSENRVSDDPGDSTQFFIYRKNECVANRLAAKAHADDTYIYIDEQGAKISKFRENCIDLHGKYYEDVEIMKRVARKIRAFHDEGYDLPDWEEYNYDPIWQCERLFKEASKMKGDLFKIFEKEWIMLRKLQKYADMDGVKHTMCHNDINIDNVLMTEDTLDIIDYEFAGYNDPGYDFGRVIAGLDYEVDEPKIKDILEAYFGRPATEKEHLHWMAYSAIHNWYYVGWALYKESINESSRDWMVFFYKQAKKLASWCLPQYEAIYGPMEDPKAACIRKKLC